MSNSFRRVDRSSRVAKKEIVIYRHRGPNWIRVAPSFPAARLKAFERSNAAAKLYRRYSSEYCARIVRCNLCPLAGCDHWGGAAWRQVAKRIACFWLSTLDGSKQKSFHKVHGLLSLPCATWWIAFTVSRIETSLVDYLSSVLQSIHPTVSLPLPLSFPFPCPLAMRQLDSHCY